MDASDEARKIVLFVSRYRPLPPEIVGDMSRDVAGRIRRMMADAQASADRVPCECGDTLTVAWRGDADGLRAYACDACTRQALAGGREGA